MTRVCVEAAFGTTLAAAVSTGGTWTDITQRVDTNAGISITRGAQDELSQIQPGTCTMELDNSDGALTPEYTGSPYYPNVVDGVPIRVNVATVTTNFVRNPSFEGGALETWEWATGVEVTTPVTPVKTGSNAARIAWNASVSDYVQTTVYGLTIGATCTASAYVRVPAGDVAVRIRMGGVTSSASAVNDTYTRLTATFTATASVMTLQVIPSTTPAAGDLVFVDAVMVEESATASALNYLTNTTFETNTSGWSSSGTPTFARSTVRANNGAASLLVTWGTTADQFIETIATNLDVGSVYTASAYVWVPAGGTPVQLRAAGVVSGAASTVTDAWQRISVTWTQPAGGTTRNIRVQPVTTPAVVGHQVWVDAAQVQEGSSATAWNASMEGAQLHERFWGLVNQWPARWGGLYSTVSVTATDVLSVLSRAEEQMRPMLIQECLLWGPNAFYPMDEGADATSAGDVSGLTGPQSLAVQQAGSGGTLEFGAGSAPLGLSGAPLFTPASASAGKFLRAELGGSAQGSSLTQALLLEFWFATSTAGRSMVSIASADRDYYLVLSLASATGFLTVTSKQSGGTAVTTTAGTANLADGRLHHVIYDAEVQELYVDGVSIGAFAGILAVQDLSTLTVGANQVGGSLWSGSISAVAVYFDTSMSASSLADHYTCGTTGYAGETADERAFRLTAYIGLNFGDSGTFTTGIAEQAALGRTCLEHLRDVEATESGKLYASRGAPQIQLQARSVRYNPSSALSIVYADFEPGDFELAYDTQKVANVLTLSRPGGATQRMVHAASKAARGPIGRAVDTLCTSDLVVTDLGNWLLYRYAVPVPELRGVTIEAFTMGLATYRTLMAADISTVFTVTSMPAQAPTSSMSATVEGYREDIRHNQHSLQFLTSRTVTSTVWVLDDPLYSVLDSTTRLAY
jgi:hypothetical protein